MTFKPTEEQVSAADKFLTGKRLVVKAYAGTGKTSTLVHVAKQTRKRGLYVCFNKAIADESAKKFPGTVTCKTGHALAFRAMVKRYPVDRMTSNLNAGILAAKLRLQGKVITDDFVITPRGWGYLMAQTVKRFMQSGRPELTARDVRLEGKLDMLDDGLKAEIVREVYADSLRLWEQIQDPRADVPISHDGYLKLWALTKPQLDADYIMLDEAQDTNGVMMELMRIQQAQMVAVGDSHQQIYEWRGAQNAMELLPSDLEARLSTSFRFGQGVADHATRVLTLLGETVPLRGNPAMTSTVGPIDKPDAVLFRTNSALLEAVFDAVEDGRNPHVVGGVSDILDYVDGAEKLMNGAGPLDRPADFFGFSDWSEVQYEARRPEGQDLKRWVDLIDKYGVQALRSTLRGLPMDEKRAGVVLCTGHKSKGREWHKVRLADDFLRGIDLPEGQTDRTFITPDESMHPELRLFYVAATRGQHQLEVHPQLAEKMTRLEKGAEMKASGATPAAQAA